MREVISQRGAGSANTDLAGQFPFKGIKTAFNYFIDYTKNGFTACPGRSGSASPSARFELASGHLREKQSAISFSESELNSFASAASDSCTAPSNSRLRSAKVGLRQTRSGH